MSIPQSAGGPISSRDDLVGHLAEGSKPKADWRIGTEHEKFVYDLRTTTSRSPMKARPASAACSKACAVSAGRTSRRATTSSA